MTEKIKNYLGIAVIIAVLLVGVAAWSYARTYARTVEPSTYRSFSVMGEGKAVAVPDVAEFSFSVITEGGKDLAALQAENTAKSERAIAFVKGQGVADADIRTEGYNVEPRYQNSYCGGVVYANGVTTCPPASIVGYTVSLRVVVKVRDFAKVGSLLSGVVTNGANSVSQLAFTQDDPTAAQSEARAEAIAQAKEKAKEIAKAGGFKVGRLLGIDEGGYGYPYPYAKDGYGGMMEMSVAQSAAPRVAVEPGSQEVMVTVTLRYEIE